ALVSDAPILLLDEPTIALDVQGSREFHRIVQEMHESGKTILYTTHIMQEADILCERVAIIDSGQIIALDSPTDLKAQLSSEKTSVITIEGTFHNGAIDRIRSLPGIAEVTSKPVNGSSKECISIHSHNSRALLPQVLSAILKTESIIDYVSPQDISLEDVFVSITGRSLSHDTRVA
ncbi:MAG: ABC transporter ATP-binding protein, partial [Candidatus Hodarchaeota archaeon]